MLNQEKMPGAGSVTDTIEFMKQMWSGMGAPSMVAPSLSVEDINKKIGDLKTVASWLELNLNMLKATIQTMEVQSATLSTLQAMSAILASRGTPAADEEKAEAAAPAFPFGFPMWPNSAPAAAEDEPDESAGEQALPDEPPAEEEEEAESVVPPADAAPGIQAAIANPNAWWNVLQEQFKHAVGNALAGGQAEQEPLLKPVKAGKSPVKPPKKAKRSENKTVPKTAAKARSAAPKARSGSVSVTAGKGGKAAKPAVKKPAPGKAPKSPANASVSARAGVVQSPQNKKPASRKPTSP
jgi:hypothetical protein